MEHLYGSSERFFLHLYTLLQQFPDRSGPVEECLREIGHAEVVFHPGSELSTVHIRRMYEARTRLSPDAVDMTSGDTQLLEALDREKEPSLRFISIATRNGLFMLFTDIRIERLIGLVRSPKSMEHILASIDSTDATLFVQAGQFLVKNSPVSIYPQFDF
jgi:hypothetical protein